MLSQLIDLFCIIFWLNFLTNLLNIKPLRGSVITETRSRNSETGYREVRLQGDRMEAWKSPELNAFQNYEDLWRRQLERNEINQEAFDGRMVELADNRVWSPVSKVLLLGPKKDVGVGIIGLAGMNYDLRNNLEHYDKIYRRKLQLKIKRRNDILKGKFGQQRRQYLRKYLRERGKRTTPSSKTRPNPIKMAAFAVDKAHRKFDSGSWTYLAAYRDKILGFQAGRHQIDAQGDAIQLPPKVTHLKGNLYTDGYDNAISYHLRPLYGQANYFGQEHVRTIECCSAEAEGDHKLAMYNNVQESLLKREFFVTEDFDGYTFTEDGRVLPFRYRVANPNTSDRKMRNIFGRRQLPREIWMTLKKKNLAQLKDTPEFTRTREQKIWQNVKFVRHTRKLVAKSHRTLQYSANPSAARKRDWRLKRNLRAPSFVGRFG